MQLGLKLVPKQLNSSPRFDMLIGFTAYVQGFDPSRGCVICYWKYEQVVTKNADQASIKIHNVSKKNIILSS